MVFRSGLLLACAAVFLQVAVFLQPLLPKQYQIAPVCETITLALLKPKAQMETMSHDAFTIIHNWTLLPLDSSVVQIHSTHVLNAMMN